KSFRTRDAPTPTYTSTNSEPLIEKNGTPASPATARASSVFPVPGGPTSSTPFGIRAPSRAKRSGFFRNSTTSTSSSFASSAPATSSKSTPSRALAASFTRMRSEERRVGKEQRYRRPQCAEDEQIAT